MWTMPFMTFIKREEDKENLTAGLFTKCSLSINIKQVTEKR